MLVVERHQRIIEQLEEKRIVRVSELSKKFSVTEETIRRDLEKLEKEGYLTRSHGGAVFNEMVKNQEIPFAEREITNISKKKLIAQMSVRHVDESDTILLDASSTAWYMAKILPNMPLTVVTNSIKVAATLSEKDQITVICTGGTLLNKSLSFVGSLTIQALDQYFVNKAFISCKGLDLEQGFTESNEQQALVKRKMLERSRQTFLMLDDSKIDVQAFAKVAHLQAADYLLINQPLDKHLYEKIHEQHEQIKVISK
ncbi:DeoR/GlpR family DNA-binding transcription regulator [Amphibacillus indicireducens]|uniref:Rhamnose catabolism operon transcriptional regulator RhaR n=1 Tax=Amphibacillus indicireducens TaxID=1076330 RepID=A0ABP7V207_9BACI